MVAVRKISQRRPFPDIPSTTDDVLRDRLVRLESRVDRAPVVEEAPVDAPTTDVTPLELSRIAVESNAKYSQSVTLRSCKVLPEPKQPQPSKQEQSTTSTHSEPIPPEVYPEPQTQNSDKLVSSSSSSFPNSSPSKPTPSPFK
ncbi:hypothetical protein ACLOJK_008564 [Asimina triloba]